MFDMHMLLGALGWGSSYFLHMCVCQCADVPKSDWVENVERMAYLVYILLGVT